MLYGPHGAPDFFTADDIATLFATAWRGALQLQPHRRAADRPEAALGAPRRRRGRAAPVEHPRQRLRGRHDRLHRRHADHPRPRRPEPGRLRLSRRRSSRRSCGRSASSRPATRVRFAPCRSPRRARRAAAQERGDRDAAPRAPRASRPPPRAGGRRADARATSAARGDRPRSSIRQAGDDNLLVEYGPAGARPRRCASACTR